MAILRFERHWEVGTAIKQSNNTNPSRTIQLKFTINGRNFFEKHMCPSPTYLKNAARMNEDNHQTGCMPRVLFPHLNKPLMGSINISKYHATS